LWNYNESSPNNWAGISNATVIVASNPTFTVGVTTFPGMSFTQGPGTNGYTGEDYSFPGNVLATGQYVRFTNITTFASTYVGLAEIRFFAEVTAVPEPSTGLLLLVGGLILRLRTRRHG
jgi:PEP-CTERM motif